MIDEEPNNETEAEAAEIEDIEELQQALAEEKQKAETNLAGWQRAQADFENYKKRSEQEKGEMSRFANSTLMLNLLPALDDLERALDLTPPELAEHGWLDGVKLIERKLKATLEAHGLSPIKALGEPFDPNLHEAVRQAEGDDGMVIEEIEKGYKLYDRVIRPSKVVVGNGEMEDVNKIETADE